MHPTEFINRVLKGEDLSNYSKEKRWINKKLRSGVSKKELLNTVGMFSNKKKEKVMAQKGLTEQEYKKRYDFLSRVYYILSNE